MCKSHNPCTSLTCFVQYMIILFLVFVVQFSVSCASLALNRDQQNQLLEVGWNHTATARSDIEKNLNCCGYHYFDKQEPCDAVSLCKAICKKSHGVKFQLCHVDIGHWILGVWLTYRYRNQKDPRANPSAFL
ncbi:hypothetical protein GDO78_017472 [Eleutherodactylus coqui]|uniref:Uncharacterized protein n=1 Tax=Eleutherodactylus coqui TaxID=57060 RepID=A0A8J6EB87_ELECQ|nr:hypothetical protein GDO78_017472 [Eleutherodactylus coqui]